MKVKDIMTSSPVCCTPDMHFGEIAKMMVENDCGAIPVVNNETQMNPIGIITDRDIVVRVLAKDENPLKMKVKDYMSHPCAVVMPETSIAECCTLMEDKQIRRVLVSDKRGRCCGIVSQADIADHNLKEELVEVVEMVSQPHKHAVK